MTIIVFTSFEIASQYVYLSTSSLIFPSFEGDPINFGKVIYYHVIINTKITSQFVRIIMRVRIIILEKIKAMFWKIYFRNVNAIVLSVAKCICLVLYFGICTSRTTTNELI